MTSAQLIRQLPGRREIAPPGHDRRPVRPKRPKPERRTFEAFQEDLAAKVEAEAAGAPTIEVTIVETTEVIAEIVTPPQPPAEPPPARQSPDEFGEGL